MITRTSALLVAVATATILSCAKPAPRPEPVRARPIDLSPRCSVQAPASIPPDRATDAVPRETDRSQEGSPREEVVAGVRLFVKPAPRPGLATLSWGFPLVAADASSQAMAAPRLGAALLRAGETTGNPISFRRRLLELGASISTSVEGGWLWLELRFPETRRAEVFAALEQWLDPRPVQAEAFERIRREVALARLAEEASATQLAARVFREVHPPPPGALDPEALATDDPDATPEDVRAELESVLVTEGSVVLYAGAEDSSRVGAALEEMLARRSPADAPEATTSRTWPSTEPGGSADWSDGASATTGNERAAAAIGEPSILVVDRPGSAQAEILVGFPTLPPRAPEFADLELWANLLGGGVGGRLFRDLRERQGLAYIIVAQQSAEGRFVVSTRSRPERVVALLQGIEAHLRALVDTELEDCEVAMLQRRRTGEQALLIEDAAAWIARSRVDVAVSGEPRPLAAPSRRTVEALRADLEVVAEAHLSGRPTIVVVGDAARLRDDLAAAFADRRIREVEVGAAGESR